MYWIQRLENGPKRVNHAAVAIGNKIYSFGGYCSEEDMQDRIDVYAFDTGSLDWYLLQYQDKGAPPSGLYGHSAVAYKNKVYIWGGIDYLNKGSSKLYCFDIASLTWTCIEATGHVPKATDGHSACVIENYMYIFGGFESDSEVLVNMLYRLDFNTFKWERIWAKGKPPIERDFHTASVIGDRMYIFGGRSSLNNDVDEMYYNEMMYFDTSNNTWFKPNVLGEEPRGRRSHSAAVYDGEIYIFGGCSPDYAVQFLHLNDVHKFNPSTNQWMELHVKGNAFCPRRRHCSVVVGDQLFLFGGSSLINVLESSSGRQFLHSSVVFPPRLKEESDIFVLDMCTSLKRLSQLKVINYGLPLKQLPFHLQNEIRGLERRRSSIISTSLKRRFESMA